MADDTFALSPLSARPTLPTEADYEAICEAFMETSRGRWFLSEYASRNRHSDTRTVLDAVERIEATLARQQLARAALSDAVLGGIAEAVGNAKGRALGLQTADTGGGPLAGVKRAAQAIRDVSWTLRECGADTRICDLLDSQTTIIADGCARAPDAPDATAALAAVFEELAAELDALVRGDARKTLETSARTAETSAAFSAKMTGDAIVESTCDETLDAEATEGETMEDENSLVLTAAVAEAAEAEAAIAGPVFVDAAFDGSAAAEATLADMAYDAALMDETVAEDASAEAAPVEMDFVEPEVAAIAIAEPNVAETDVAETDISDTSIADTSIATTNVAVTNTADTLPAPFSPAASQEASSSRSLGAALVNGGLIDHRSRPDPLAALRKMSYAEKIALFS
jgi:hypothetical protein